MRKVLSLCLALLLVSCGVKQSDGSIIDEKLDRANKQVDACLAKGGTAHMSSRYDTWYGQVWEVTCDVSPK